MTLLRCKRIEIDGEKPRMKFPADLRGNPQKERMKDLTNKISMASKKSY